MKFPPSILALLFILSFFSISSAQQRDLEQLVDVHSSHQFSLNHIPENPEQETNLLFIPTVDKPADVFHKMVCQSLMKREYYLYLPEQVDLHQKYWLVCYAHGFKGHAQDEFSNLKYFLERGDCIVVAPTFPKGYQLLENQADQQVIEIFNELKKKYQLHQKLFVFGHSAGGQFAHRFTLRHPNIVVGCEACSSGTWATGGPYHSLTKDSQSIPIAIACGEKDQGKIGLNMAQLSISSLGVVSPSDIHDWTRIEWLIKFSGLLSNEKFFFKSQIFPGESHQVSIDEQEELAKEAFLLGTSGMLPEEYKEYNLEITAIQESIEQGKSEISGLAEIQINQLQQKVHARSKENLKKQLINKGWRINDSAIEQCLKASENFVNEKISALQIKALHLESSNETHEERK